jgi:hypothetical protein
LKWSFTVASCLTVLAKGKFRFFSALSLAVVLLASGGCQNNGALNNAREGMNASVLAPRSVEDYARQRNISNDQARRELQAAVSKRDADEALKNADDAGVTTESGRKYELSQ